ncbi:MAG: heme NO-binding domain-containing protein [Qingshengfaniella sp.]
MHGLFNRALHWFVRDTGGAHIWRDIARAMQVPETGFEAVLIYDDAVTEKLLALASMRLGKTRDILLEDLGTYLVSNPNLEPLRRLLRFGGATYPEFLYSLDDLPRRARLAVPDLDVPQIEVSARGPNLFAVHCWSNFAGFSRVLGGMLRSIADDYGALVLIDFSDSDGDGAEDMLKVEVLRSAFVPGRPFRLHRG